MAVYLGAVLVLAGRLRRAGHNERRHPGAGPRRRRAALRGGPGLRGPAARRCPRTLLDAALLIALLSVPATAVGFLFGLVQWRVYSGGALGRLTMGLAATSDPPELQNLLVGALERTRAKLYYAELPPAGLPLLRFGSTPAAASCPPPSHLRTPACTKQRPSRACMSR